MAWIRNLDQEVLIVPGTHDVGDTAAIRPDQTVDDARLAAWRDIVGPDRWVRDAAGWRLIGLNAMLLGSGHPEEERQFDWLAEALDHAGPMALVLHKPLFIDHPDEEPRGYWTVLPEPRRRILALMAGRPVQHWSAGPTLCSESGCQWALTMLTSDRDRLPVGVVLLLVLVLRVSGTQRRHQRHRRRRGRDSDTGSFKLKAD